MQQCCVLCEKCKTPNKINLRNNQIANYKTETFSLNILKTILLLIIVLYILPLFFLQVKIFRYNFILIVDRNKRSVPITWLTTEFNCLLHEKQSFLIDDNKN